MALSGGQGRYRRFYDSLTPAQQATWRALTASPPEEEARADAVFDRTVYEILPVLLTIAGVGLEMTAPRHGDGDGLSALAILSEWVRTLSRLMRQNRMPNVSLEAEEDLARWDTVLKLALADAATVASYRDVESVLGPIVIDL